VITLTDYESQNKRTASENANLYTKLEELLGNQGLLQKVIKKKAAMKICRITIHQFKICQKIGSSNHLFYQIYDLSNQYIEGHIYIS